MEPERDIEKELKAHAQQRRAAAGAPPPLHPVNRKALQAEAARLAKSPDTHSRSWWQIFFGSWPRLVVAGAAAVAVVLATMHLLGPTENRHERFQSFAAARQMVEESKTKLAPPAAVPAAIPLDQPRTSSIVVAEASPPAPPPVATAAPAVPVPSTLPPLAADVPPPPTGAYAPAARHAAPTFAQNTPVPRDRESSSSSGQLDKGVSGLAPPPATVSGGGIAGSSQSFNRLVTADASAALITQRFRRTEPSAKTTKTFSVSDLLASFKVEQDLGELRIVDGDGSVYSGSVEQTPESGKTADGFFEKKASEKEGVQVKTARPMQAFHFRVSGTNRTLQEEVIFTGNFLTATAPQPALATNAIGGVTFGSSAPAGAVQPVLFELHKARMEGQLLLGGTNKLEIKAAPVKR